jgi:hypothetical protein
MLDLDEEIISPVTTPLRLPGTNEDINVFLGKLKYMMDCHPGDKDDVYNKLMTNLLKSHEICGEKGVYNTMIPCLLVKHNEKYTAQLKMVFANKAMYMIYKKERNIFCYASRTCAVSEVEIKLVEVTSANQKKKQ